MADNQSDMPLANGDRSMASRPDPSGQGYFTNALVALLIFVVGVAVGFPFATFGVSLFAENAVGVISGLMAVLVVVLVAAGTVFLFRERLWRALFKRSEIEAARLAKPLGDIARFASENNVQKATLAARDFAEIAVARYSWIATRRWMVATLTALVVAIVALAAAGFLFQQNVLLKDQSALLADQNNRISDQTALMQA